MKPVIVYLSAVIFLAACSSSPRSQVFGEPDSFKGKFIKDIAPLANPESPTLQDYALTLPVYESNYEDVVDWVTKRDGAIYHGDTWKLVSDGAQSPVTVIKHPTPSSKPQRIQVRIGPFFYGFETSKWVWVYELERSNGGWKKISTKKKTPASISGAVQKSP